MNSFQSSKALFRSPVGSAAVERQGAEEGGVYGGGSSAEDRVAEHSKKE